MAEVRATKKWRPRYAFVALRTSTAGRTPGQWLGALSAELAAHYGSLRGGVPLDLVHWGDEAWAAGPPAGAPVVLRVPAGDAARVLAVCALLVPPTRVLAASPSLLSAMAAVSA